MYYKLDHQSAEFLLTLLSFTINGVIGTPDISNCCLGANSVAAASEEYRGPCGSV